jgi:hypothetical protein
MKAFNERLIPIEDRLKNWWEFGEQEYPCIVARAMKDDHGHIPDTDDLARFWSDPDFVIDRQMKIIDNTNYYCDAVPFHYVDFGASAMAGVLGAQMEYVNKEAVWPLEFVENIEKTLEVGIKRESFSYKTIMELTKRSAAISNGHHFVTSYALGGPADNIAGIYGTQPLLMDMVAKPEKVKKSMEHMKRLWIEAFNEINNVIEMGKNRGYCGWAEIWAPGTTFPIQEDFSYMISADMFREFCIPHVADIADAMDFPFYHLDGITHHIEPLLELTHLKVIQWDPGPGKERLSLWYDFLKHILSRNKSIQVYGTVDEIDELINNIGARGVLVVVSEPTNDEAEMMVEKYGYGNK